MASPTKAYFKVEGGSTKLYCLYNPDSFSLVKETEWIAPEASPGKALGQTTYGGAKPATLSLKVTFDTTDTGESVTNYTGALLALMDVDTTISGTTESSNNQRPRTVTFVWGSLSSFESVVTRLSINFTYFAASGTPLRADVDIDLLQYNAESSFGPQNPTSGTPRPHRVHRVQPGETLDRISAKYYGDATKWRALASANALEDPLGIRPGTVLSIPQLGGD